MFEVVARGRLRVLSCERKVKDDWKSAVGILRSKFISLFILISEFLMVVDSSILMTSVLLWIGSGVAIEANS